MTFCLISFPLFASGGNEDIHNYSLICPQLNIENLSGSYNLDVYPKGPNGPSTSLQFYWDDNKKGPSLNLQAEILNRITSDIFKFFNDYFNERQFPKTIRIAQTDLSTDVGALYCRSYQKNPEKSVTLFLAAKSLESHTEFTRLLAHELTHHWFFKNHKNPEIWIEEGIAYLSEYIATRRLSGEPVLQYLKNSNVSLVTSNIVSPIAQMGQAQLLFTYLFNHIGPAFLEKVLSFDTLNMAGLATAISQDNPYGWSSFHDAFRDFQIAKFINREDYQAQTEAARKRYFLFATSLKAQTSMKLDISEWSGAEILNADNWTRPQSLNYENLNVIDDPGQSITVTPLKGSTIALPGKRHLQILYENKLQSLTNPVK